MSFGIRAVYILVVVGGIVNHLVFAILRPQKELFFGRVAAVAYMGLSMGQGWGYACLAAFTRGCGGSKKSFGGSSFSCKRATFFPLLPDGKFSIFLAKNKHKLGRNDFFEEKK